MLESKKILRAIKKEKQELSFIKSQLEDSTPKIDTSNIYIWYDKKLYSIVKLNVEKIHGRNFLGQEINGYQSTLIDIFTNNIVYEKNSTKIIQREERIIEKRLGDGYSAFLLPLHDVDVNLLAYADKKVPLYILQQLYYKLNKVDINAHLLKKQK